jgi:zinc protease
VRSILEARLLHQVRVVMGKVYSPSVSMASPDDADQGMISVTLEASPDEIRPLVDSALEVAGDLAGGTITQEELDAARQPVLASADQALSDNAAWASMIAYASTEPTALRELTGLRADMEALTLEDVRKAAATWLKPKPMIARALPAGR